MEELEFESGMENEKKVMVTIFWVNRKAARTEGCAPFLIKKIVTGDRTYVPEGTHLLKITDEIMADMVSTLDAGKPVDMDYNIGNENIEVTLSNGAFSVAVEKNPEIEDEIINKLQTELTKKFPSLCDSFKPRVTPLE
jgi:hypothetical protein